MGTVGRRAAGFSVWYLRGMAGLNLLGAARVPLGADIRRPDAADRVPPHLLAAGFTSGAVALLLAAPRPRRTRARGSV